MSVPSKKAALGVAAKKAKREGTAESLERVQEARRELAAAKLESHIKAVVAESGPLSEAQKSDLSRLLRGAS